MAETGGSRTEGWLAMVEEALQKATVAASDAWKASEGAREQAWDTTKRAFNQAADAVDQGLQAARSTWGETGAGHDEPQQATGNDTTEIEPGDEADTAQ